MTANSLRCVLALGLASVMACDGPAAPGAVRVEAPPPAASARVEQEQAQGDDVLVVLDASGSMQAFAASGDPTTCFQVAQRALLRWIAARRSGRVGVVIFGANASVLAPPTEDYATVAAALGAFKLGGVSANGTALGEALALGVARLRSLGYGRRIVLLTDGEHEYGDNVDPRTAAQQAKGEGVRVHVVQIGDSEEVEIQAGVDIFDEPVVRRQRTTRDRTLLRSLADETGGTYVVAKTSEEVESAVRAVAP